MTAAVINVGSINIDYIYRVPHLVQPGETLSSLSLDTVLGGKGANQSVAVARAGVSVTHVGRVSRTDRWAVDSLAGMGVDVQHVELIDGPSGHAIIQVDDNGENSIVLHGGANQGIELATLKTTLQTLADSSEGADYLLMQNECNVLADAIDIASAIGIKVALNPAPMTDAVKQLRLDAIDTLIVNELEAQTLCGVGDVDGMIRELALLAPATRVVITLGAEGAVLLSDGQVTRASSPTVNVVDTTGAGDTFVGYFIAGLVDGLSEQESLQRACNAAAVAVTTVGATPSIPSLAEVH